MQRFELRNLHSASTVRTYSLETEELAGIVEGVIRKLPRWELVPSPEGEIRAVRHTRLFRFEDDVRVRLIPSSSGVHANTRAELESVSRIGIWDRGRNRRNLRDLLAAVDRELIDDR